MRTQLFMANLLLLAGNTSAQTSFVHCSLDSVVLANLRQKLVCEDSSYNRKHIPVYYSSFAHAQLQHESCALLVVNQLSP